jgi:hopanoid biosynthesis associated protein HpnK
LKRLIVTADDFGLSVPVNEAVEEAHRRGILTAASLMVGAPAAADAVARARRLPKLGVGLHLVLVDGAPVSPPESIPALTGSGERLPNRPYRIGAAISFDRRARRQMEAEVRAQFEAFRRTGLALDHVNAHHHYHLHLGVAGAIVALAREFKVRAVRVPSEPFWNSFRAMGEGFWPRLVTYLFYLLPVALLRRKLRGAGLASNDTLFGLNDSGRMTRDRVLKFLEHLPDGVSEIYCHPAMQRSENIPADNRCGEEFKALVDPGIAAAVRRLGIELVPFAALTARETV